MDAGRYLAQLGSETIIYGIAGTLSRFIGIFLIPLYTRVFSPADYGIVAIITALLGLLNTFIVLGLDNSSARWFYDSEDLQERKKVIGTWFWSQTVVGCLAALVMLALAVPLARVFLSSEENAGLVRLAAVLVPLSTFGKVVGNWLRYQRRPWMTAAFFTLSSLGTIGLVILFVLVLDQGLAGLYRAQIAAGVLTALAAMLILQDWIRPHLTSRKILHEMLQYGLPLVPAAIAAWITASADRFILQLFRSPDEVGVYAIAASLTTGITLVTTAFQMAWGPFALSILKEQAAGLVYSKVFSLYALLGSLLGTAVSLFRHYLLAIFTTPDYYGAASSIPFLASAFVVIGTTYIFSTGPAIVKRSMPVAASIFIGAGINTALNLLLIPAFGKDGAAVATLAAYSCAAVYLYSASQRLYPIPYRPKVALVCFGFSWLLTGIDYLFLPAWGAPAFMLRIGMCALFIPLAFWQGLVRPVHVRNFWIKYTDRFLSEKVS